MYGLLVIKLAILLVLFLSSIFPYLMNCTDENNIYRKYKNLNTIILAYQFQFLFILDLSMSGVDLILTFYLQKMILAHLEYDQFQPKKPTEFNDKNTSVFFEGSYYIEDKPQTNTKYDQHYLLFCRIQMLILFVVGFLCTIYEFMMGAIGIYLIDYLKNDLDHKFDL